MKRLSDPGRTQGNHHSPDTDANVGSDLEQSEANGAALSLCQVGNGTSSVAAGSASEHKQGKRTTGAVDCFHASWVEVRSLNKSS